ncbi:MAG TPA: hypothetical protein PKL48_15850, partial [Thermodesulfobacteriota bacterium]|nr:hypothetical protein [Thermodesulfobacteriota bacterium]
MRSTTTVIVDGFESREERDSTRWNGSDLAWRGLQWIQAVIVESGHQCLIETSPEEIFLPGL